MVTSILLFTLFVLMQGGNGQCAKAIYDYQAGRHLGLTVSWACGLSYLCTTSMGMYNVHVCAKCNYVPMCLYVRKTSTCGIHVLIFTQDV